MQSSRKTSRRAFGLGFDAALAAGSLEGGLELGASQPSSSRGSWSQFEDFVGCPSRRQRALPAEPARATLWPLRLTAMARAAPYRPSGFSVGNKRMLFTNLGSS